MATLRHLINHGLSAISQTDPQNNVEWINSFAWGVARSQEYKSQKVHLWDRPRFILSVVTTWLFENDPTQKINLKKKYILLPK